MLTGIIFASILNSLLVTLAASASVLSSLTSYYTLVNSVTYTLNLTFTSTSIPASSQAVLTLTSDYNINATSIQACNYLTNSGSAYALATCTPSSNSSNTIVTFSSIYPTTAPTQTSLSLTFQITNPWASTSESYTLAIVSSGSTLLTAVNSISYSASSLNNCGWLSSSVVNGALSTRTISFTPSVSVITGSYLTITLPLWFNTLPNLGTSSLTCSPISNIDTSSPTCTNSTSGSSEIYKIANIFSSNKTVNGIISFNISSIYNPYSLYPFGTITYSLIYTSGSSSYVSQTCSGLTQTTTTLNSMNSFGISFFSIINYASSSKTGWFKITNPLPSTGQLQLTWTGGVTISFTVSGSAPYLLALNSTSLTIGNFSQNYNPNSNISIFSRFNVNAPKSSRTFTITATSYYVSGTTTYGIETMTNSYSCSPGMLSPVTLTETSPYVNAATTLSLTITLANAVYSGSYIGVSFPLYLTVTVGSTCTANSSFIACAVTASNYSNLTVSGTVAAATTILITYNAAQNPPQQLTTNSLTVTTYIDSASDGIIDQVTSGLTLTISPKQLPSNSLYVLPSNTTTYAYANYTFSLTLSDPIPASGYIIIIFPSTLQLNSPALISATFPTTTCTTSVSGLNVTLANCFSSSLTNLASNLVISGIINPNSMATTAPFQVYTYGPIGMVNYLTTGPTLTMSSLAQSPSFTATPASYAVHTTTTYTFAITFYGSHSSGDYLFLTLPSAMSFSATPTCTPLSGIAALSCTTNSTNLTITLVAVPSSSISFTVSNILNYDLSNTPITLSATTYTSTNYATEQATSNSVTFTPTTLTANVVENNGIALNQASTILLNITTPYALSSSFSASSTSLKITLPSELTTLANTSCTATNATCSLSGSIFTLNNVGLSLSNYAVTLNNVMVPSLSGATSSFTINYLYNSQIIASANTGITLTAYCSSPCQRCLTSPSDCQSCLPTPNTLTIYFPSNHSCLSSCPNYYYLATSTCMSCISPCLSCSTSIICITCAAGYTFYATNSSCLNGCPSSYYNNSNNCTPCVGPCSTCTSSTSCLSCAYNYLTGTSCVLASACPSTTFPNATSLICESCLLSCATCNDSTSCLTCATNYFYYNSICTNTCPNSTYLSNSNCLPCDYTCATCNNTSTNCTACNASALLYQNICTTGCPPGTYNSSTACSSCSLTCTTCTSTASTCTSCTNPLFLQSNTCTSTCSSTTYPDTTTQTCTNCSTSCLTCSLAPSNCTSCSPALLLYSNACSPSCPTNYFNISGNCQTCPNCQLCLSISVCSTCLSGYLLYSAACYTTCPPNAPVPDYNNMICTLCGTTCTSCSSDASQCYACISNYLLLSGKCYTACPSGYNANYTTNSCIAIKYVSTFYYPCSIASVVVLLIVILSKIIQTNTDFIGNTLVVISVSALVSNIILLSDIQENITSSTRLLSETLPRILATTVDNTTLVSLSILSILISVILGCLFVGYLIKSLNSDAGLTLWRARSRVNKYALNVSLALTCMRVTILRIIYGRIFGRQCFSCYVYANSFFLRKTIWFSIASMTCNILAIAVSLLIVTGNLGTNQTQIYSIDCIVISSLQIILLVLDMCLKRKEHFKNILTDLPYLRKFKKYQEQESSDGSLISLHQNDQIIRCKTQADKHPTLPIGAYGIISEELQRSDDGRSIVKTLPENNALNAHIQFDPYEEKRINDELFFQQREYTKKFNQLKEEFQVEKEEQQANQNNQNATQFQHPFGISKTGRDIQKDKNVEQIINQIPRQIDPAKYLRDINAEDYQQIQQDDLKELDRLAAKHQVDPKLVRSLFGIKKHHNPRLLNQVMDHQEQVPSQSVQQLINSKNSQAKLQEMLGRDSTIQAHKLRAILNDPESAKMLEALLSEQNGLFSMNTLKALLSTGFSVEYLKNLLTQGNVDQAKLKALLQSCGEDELSGLQALKQLGGDNLQKVERLKNMMGSESELDPRVIPKIAEQMSEASKSTIFDKSTPSTSTIVRKVINNRNIHLSPLNPIQQMPQIVQQFAELLNCGNQQIENDLIEMLQKGEYDGQELKQIVKQAGNSQQEMAKLLKYIQNKKQQPSEFGEPQKTEENDLVNNLQELSQQNSNYLDFDMDTKELTKKTQNYQEDFDEEANPRRIGTRTRYRKKELPQIHLPSQPIYLQRIQGAHQLQKNRNIRKKKKKVVKHTDKFMDEDNQIYDLNF